VRSILILSFHLCPILPSYLFLSAILLYFRVLLSFFSNKYNAFKLVFPSSLPPTQVAAFMTSFSYYLPNNSHPVITAARIERDIKHNSFRHISKPLGKDYRHQRRGQPNRSLYRAVDKISVPQLLQTGLR
jgi:hypothetical protein